MTATGAGMMQASPAQPQTPASRKRRRRAPTTGATEDCHTCRKRGASCDRRRPYCSQCLEIGKECSGYRTTLTWGVGVASRGKLRGKTLPVLNVVNAQPAASQPSMRTPTSAKMPQPSPGRHNPPSMETDISEGPRKRARIDSHGGDAVDTSAMSAPLPSPPASIPDLERRSEHREWFPQQQPQGRRQTHAAFATPPPLAHHQYMPRRHESLQNLHAGYDQHVQPLVHSTRMDMVPPMPPFGDRYLDPQTEQYPRTPESAPHFVDPFLSQYTNGHRPRQVDQAYQADPTHDPDSQNAAPLHWSPEHMQHVPTPATTTSMRAPHMPPPPNWQNKDPVFDGAVESQSWQSIALADQPHAPQAIHSVQQSSPASFNDSVNLDFPGSEDMDAVDAEYSTADGMTLIPYGGNMTYNINPMMLDISPRMRQLLDHYDRAICPVLVAFDGSSNPYRQHILPLALQNPGLQNALAALATNNIRMRKVQNVPQLKNESDTASENFAARTGKPTDEEQYYKRVSIQSLNEQLADPMKARDDSVLATLLILCLFHVCDSGFSKFKTQLAGVQKLLKLRGGHEKTSEFVGWVEMFFAWFDVMTSAVNDRELQVHGDSLDLMDLSKNLGRLEQFSGCDGRLFKLIARLGRLNLLSQGRPVRGINGGMPAKLSRSNSQVRDFYSIDFEDQDEMPAYNIKKEESPAPDSRHEFWGEWRDIRQRLQELDLSRYSPSPSGDEPLPAPQQDLFHISESFRYSALLYTERLAHPSSPSSSQRFQDLVSNSMRHIEAIGRESCVLKFMLWPLFITGTESVLEHDRDTIRDMCIEIQKESGFYNNVSGLELLERVWKEASAENGTSGGCAGQAFAWRKAMDRVDGEYIVI